MTNPFRTVTVQVTVIDGDYHGITRDARQCRAWGKTPEHAALNAAACSFKRDPFSLCAVPDGNGFFSVHRVVPRVWLALAEFVISAAALLGLLWLARP